jgi:hypothetical protein
LKVGGFVALRSPDWGGIVVNPSDDRLRAAFQARLRLQQANGGDVFAGRQLGDWLRKAGLTQVRQTATYEIYPESKLIAEHLASQLDAAGEASHAQTWLDWGQNPDAIFAQAWFEATARKT